MLRVKVLDDKDLYDEQEKEGELEEAIQDEPQDELYCVLKTEVVGIQYYDGLVGPQEEVSLVREPHNQYDRQPSRRFPGTDFLTSF